MLDTFFVFPFFLIFCRLGMAVMVFPALSDMAVLVRARLLLALGTSMILLPLLQPDLPPLPDNASTLIMLVLVELMVGLCLGIAARLMMAALAVAGELIAFMAGFQSATLFDPQNGASTAAPTIFLSLMAGLIILATGLHHALLRAVVGSYIAFPAGVAPPLHDMVEAVVMTFGNFMLLGLQLAAPIIFIGLLVNLIFGIFNRLIPQLQVFFLTQPIAIILSLLLLVGGLPVMMDLFIERVGGSLTLFETETS